MNPFSMNFVAEFAELLTTALVHFLWQGAVLALILLVTVKLLDVKTARLRYLLSVGTLLMMGMAPIVTAMLHQKGNSQPQHSPAHMSGQANPIIDEHARQAPSIRLFALLLTCKKHRPLRGIPASRSMSSLHGSWESQFSAHGWRLDSLSPCGFGSM